MSTKKYFNFLVTATIACCATGVFSSCSGFIDAVVGNVDNPAPTTQPTNDAAQLKQGIWTEYDEALLTSGKYTAEELAKMPTVGMWLQGDKGYFFTYTAEDMSETVEGQINYNKSTNTGTITFPYIAGNPLSIQTVNFSMNGDDLMKFEYTYEGKKTTGTCAWLCENLDNWSSDITDEDWKALMAYYKTIAETAGPDATIDWSTSDVDDLDKPLVWNDEVAATRAGTRIAIGTVIKTGLNILGSLFQKDPHEEINEKLDAVLGKLDNVLAGQEQMIKDMNLQFNKVHERLEAIAKKLEKQEIVTLFNTRNTTYYNPLKNRNIRFFDDAYKLYNDNKDNLTENVKKQLGDYGKQWVGAGEEFLNKTWDYIDYLSTVNHTKYGTGMAAIYDGLTFDKYPWEHLGIGDRKSYRAYDMFEISKCLFMITLYTAYSVEDGGKAGLYKLYNDKKPILQAFCEFSITNPDEFRVCQIPGAHFVMRKELQKINYCGKGNKSPDPHAYGEDWVNVIYRPEWHEVGSVTINNPQEQKTKMITEKEAEAIFKYYSPNEDKMWWTKMLVDGENAGGAAYAKKPTSNTPSLILYRPNRVTVERRRMPSDNTVSIVSFSVMMRDTKTPQTVDVGDQNVLTDGVWRNYYSQEEYYAAIVEDRFGKVIVDQPHQLH